MSKFFPELSKDQVYAPIYDKEFWKLIQPIDGCYEILHKINNKHSLYIVTAMLAKEIVKTSFVKGDALIVFRNGARIDALANAQTSKGQRRKRISIENFANISNKTELSAPPPKMRGKHYIQSFGKTQGTLQLLLGVLY